MYSYHHKRIAFPLGCTSETTERRCWKYRKQEDIVYTFDIISKIYMLYIFEKTYKNLDFMCHNSVNTIKIQF